MDLGNRGGFPDSFLAMCGHGGRCAAAICSRRRSWWCLGLVCVFFFSVSWTAVAGPSDWGAVATPLRMVNLHPFHLLYGVPASFGAHVLTPGASELTASLDLASYLSGGTTGVGQLSAAPNAEWVLIDGETYRQALTLRMGFRERWEVLFEVSAVAHRAGAFDAFIETWHDTFGLNQGGRKRAPRNRLGLFYADSDGVHVDVDQDVAAFGDISVGAGYALPQSPLGNDGLAIRSAVKLPTGDASLLTGSGGFSAAVWAETSGALPGSTASRVWLYAATAGVLAGEAPRGLSELGGRWIAFGRFGMTWRPLTWLTLTAQFDAHSSPYHASKLPPLADAGVMIGFGGALRLTDRTTLEVAVTEDDGLHRSAPDIGLHIALRWRP